LPGIIALDLKNPQNLKTKKEKPLTKGEPRITFRVVLWLIFIPSQSKKSLVVVQALLLYRESGLRRSGGGRS
jgi:hypothetical protein